MWYLKYDTNELIYKTDSRHRKKTCSCLGVNRKGWIGSLRLTDANYYIKVKLNKQQCLTISHMELCNIPRQTIMEKNISIYMFV